MRYRDTAPLVLVCLSLLLLPSFVFSEVKVSLNNGREIIADRCRESNGKLLCEIKGGSFEFDKAEISKMENVTIERRRTVRDAASDTPPSDQKKDELNDGGNSTTGGKTSAEPQTGGLTREQEKKLTEVRARRAQLEADREKLMKEREELREEVKAAGVFKSGEKYEDIQKKINDMGARINTFNDQVNKLNEEISSITNQPLKKAQ